VAGCGTPDTRLGGGEDREGWGSAIGCLHSGESFQAACEADMKSGDEFDKSADVGTFAPPCERRCRCSCRSAPCWAVGGIARLGAHDARELLSQLAPPPSPRLRHSSCRPAWSHWSPIPASGRRPDTIAWKCRRCRALPKPAHTAAAATAEETAAA
jgi:hypothetical protein